MFFVGAGVNRAIKPLQSWNIPEAVTGGLIAAAATLIAYVVFRVEVNFSLEARDMLLLYFFTGIGLNAKLDDLISGGRPFLILLALTLVYLVLQNLIAAGGVAALGLPRGMTPLLGSAALIGGHGTTIAWAPIIAERFGLSNALEVGIATATLGLVVASLVGGPIAGYLIRRHALAGPKAPDPVVGVPDDPADKYADDLNHITLLRTLLILNVVILIGFALQEIVDQGPIKLPLFVICLIVGIVVTNTVPRFCRRAMADPVARAGADFRSVAERVPRHVADEHAALDARRPRRRAGGGARGPDGRGGRLYRLRRLPADGAKLRGGGDRGRVYRHHPRRDADRDRQHDRGDQAARRLRAGLHHPAARLGLLHRHRQRGGDRPHGAVERREPASRRRMRLAAPPCRQALCEGLFRGRSHPFGLRRQAQQTARADVERVSRAAQRSRR